MELKMELANAKIRITKPRSEILKVLKEHPVPMTLSEIRERIDASIDLSTIYRTVDLFERNGILTKIVHLETGNAVYEYNRHLHVHHLICVDCGRIENVEECPLGDYEARIAEQTGYAILKHQLELYGICSNCQKHAQ